jgi:hypothetical protein
MKQPTPDQMNDFVARLKIQDCERIIAFETRLTDTELKMTVQEFIETLCELSSLKSGCVQIHP